MGAKIIEKHFTINKLSSGPDHKISLSPKELRHFVHDIHRASKMLGSFEKKASKEEEPIKKIVRKSLVANSFIKKGNYFTSKGHLDELEDNELIPVKYCDENGNINLKSNPNGSMNNIAGIFNNKKNILGMMPHPERMSDKILSNENGLGLFLSLMN